MFFRKILLKKFYWELIIFGYKENKAPFLDLKKKLKMKFKILKNF